MLCNYVLEAVDLQNEDVSIAPFWFDCKAFAKEAIHIVLEEAYGTQGLPLGHMALGYGGHGKSGGDSGKRG